MAQSGYTPISLYYSSTASSTPTAGNLVNGELAINITDGKLYYKDNAGVVQIIAGKGGAGIAGGSNTQVQYNSSGSLAGSANMTFNGTSLTLANDASIHGLTVGLGSNSVTGNTALGVNALSSGSLTGGPNTAIGNSALATNTSGGPNEAFGANTLQANTTGTNNQAFGQGALNANTTGNSNSAIGRLSLTANTTGAQNIGVGQQSLTSNTTGQNNVAVGMQALQANTTASNNTAVGYQAGYSNTTNNWNTFIGSQAGYNSTGGGNTFVGVPTPIGTAGYYVTTGTKNTILGGYNGNQGGLDIRTASNYIVLSDGDGNPRLNIGSNGGVAIAGAPQNSGRMLEVFGGTAGQYHSVFQNGSTSNPQGMFLYNSGSAPNNNTNTFLYCQDNVPAARLTIFTNGGIGNFQANNQNYSDITLKKDIQLAGNYLDKLCQIPVKTYLYKDQTDDNLNLGVIAQDVQAVCPEFITEANAGTPDEPNMVLSVYQTDLQYAMLKAIQELNTLVTTQAAEIAALKAKLGA